MKQELFSITKTGAVQYLCVETFDNVIRSTFGQLGGKLQIKDEEIFEGKNIGRSNETSPELQAELEAKSKIQKKIDGGYRTSIEAAKEALTDSVTPQLAKDFLKDSHRINFKEGVWVSPKLDGVRLLSESKNNEVKFLSRNRKEFPANDGLESQIKLLMRKSGYRWLDGEYYQDNKPFQDIISCVKKNIGHPLRDTIQYHIFNVPEGKNFQEEITTIFCTLLKIIDEYNLDRIKLVESYLVFSELEAREYMDIFLSKGYEGSMLRNRYSKYTFNERSYDLQKLKDFQDSEYLIVDIISDKDDNGVFVCKDNITEQTFQVSYKATHEAKKELLLNAEDYIGKFLLVKYQGLSTPSKDVVGGLPRFPVGICVRDYE